ncbi:cytochrome C biogenesis protein [Alkalicaulis satelles]|uniref:Heme exporter protein B n=1 Tax=Alkalicaulis satelles TaxID=2609175 RepID=A0A5M6ZGI5_9PROT|nr:heme exporter protein CcmB [Alkalicaulis satelles]KAA5803862.1 cytochrome C biogenesis protein [Alkalicaulis satelles]
MSARGLFIREARLAFAGGGGPAGPAAFYLAALALAPLAIGPDAAILAAAGPGVIVFGALLASLQGAERMFADDASDGTLELYALSGLPLSACALIKALAYTLAAFWPAPVIAGMGALAYGLSLEAALALAAGIALAAPGLVFIAAFAGALAAGLRRAGLIIALIAAPLQAPLLVFAAGAARAAMDGTGLTGANLMLALAFSLAAMVLAPLGAGAALRARLE